MRFPFFLPLVLLLAACASTPRAEDRNISSGETLNWKVSGGIEIANVAGDLFVVRADPQAASLELLNPPDTNGQRVSDLAERGGFTVMINAAMFSTDYLTSIGYMRNFANVNNSRISHKLRGFLMFHPKKPGLPALQIAPREEIGNYETVFQTHRMWDAKEGILWKKGASVFHHVGLVGADGNGRILFFYHPALVDVHDLVARILDLNLDLRGLLYLDGGNHGAFYLGTEFGQGWNTYLYLPNLLGLKPSK